MSSRFNLDIVDWNKVKQVAGMIEDRSMERGDLKFGPTKITIYDVKGQGTLRIDFKVED